MDDTRFPRYAEFGPLVDVRCATPKTGRTIHRFFDTSPFSPSGRYLGLTRLMLVLRWLPDGVGGMKPNVVTMNADGSDLRIAIPAAEWLEGGHHPDWCPDGEHVMMNLKLDGRTLRLVQARFNGTRRVYETTSEPTRAATPAILAAGKE
ncbi:MAG: hypothetical protein FJ291_33635 [Planctomycetes bacterium]|nr:hypothetical protein [Planctomycetota bacterium]